ncbi:MAG: hypothetical protein K9L59_15635 [Desulfobacterales bacterium]|nr:hypothetical protein [Desulfobacterales bacterium]MCF8079954.1 hypothetical protein [Desulfobacterales bacterium]
MTKLVGRAGRRRRSHENSPKGRPVNSLGGNLSLRAEHRRSGRIEKRREKRGAGRHATGVINFLWASKENERKRNKIRIDTLSEERSYNYDQNDCLAASGGAYVKLRPKPGFFVGHGVPAVPM